MKPLLAAAGALAAFSAFSAFSASSAFAAPPQDTPAGVQRFRELYKELVETNTTLSAGSCTLAAERMAARLKAAGFPESDLHPFAAARSSEGRRLGCHLSRQRSEVEGDSVAGAYRRGGSEARGLDARPVQARRGERLISTRAAQSMTRPRRRSGSTR